MPVVIGVERRCRSQPNADSVGHLTLTVTSKGQVTLRKELLAHLGVKPGQRLDVEVLPGGRTIAGFLQKAIETGWAGLPCGERKP